jgi:predicted SAM-dependent methyltransferase
MFKTKLKKIFDSLGLELHRKNRTIAEEEEKGLQTYRDLFPQDSLTNKRFYNIGSGSFYHPYWTNLDYVSDWYQKVQINVVHIDLMEMGPLPIPPGTAEVIYTSHTIEHIKDEAVQNLFNESFKALKPGGYLRVTTGPDADLDFEALKRGDAHWFYWNKWYEKPGTYEKIFHSPATSVPLEERWLHHVASPLAPNDKSPSPVKITAEELRKLIKEKTKEELLDYLTSLCHFNPDRTGSHVSWWNYDKIAGFMRKAGFVNVYKSGYGQSACPLLRNTKYFDNTHPQISVYAEAIK